MRHLDNTTFSLLAVCTALLMVGSRSQSAERSAAAARPNMLVILVDDLGYGDLTSYGAKDLRTPHIDTLIAQGMRFDNFYANCPVCSPTRAALLTGRYPELVGVPGVIRTHADNSWGYLSPKAVLLPSLLKSFGYSTAIIGKWHLGLESPNIPNDRGFDFFHGFLGDMMDDYYTHRRHGINYMRKNREVIDPTGHATDLFTRWAVDYLRRQRPGRPFCLYLPYNAPHSPIQPPTDWLDKVRKRQPNISPKRAKLVALIEHLDNGIGQVLAALKETQLDRNTIVVFTSDNGGELRVGANNGPLRDGKQSVYEGGAQGPGRRCLARKNPTWFPHHPPRNDDGHFPDSPGSRGDQILQGNRRHQFPANPPRSATASPTIRLVLPPAGRGTALRR